MAGDNVKGLKIELVTTARQDLIDLSAILARGVSGDKLLSDTEKPVNIYVTGSYGCGKKIFPDAMRAEILGSDDACRFAGKMEFDEYWANPIRLIEVDFINTAWNAGKYSDVVNGGRYPARLMDAFRRARAYGGISFIHNSKEPANDGIQIHMEKAGYYNPWNESALPRDSQLKTDFRVAIVKNDHGLRPAEVWNRYIEIIVLDERLLQSKGFMEAAQQLSCAAARVAADLSAPDHQRQIKPLACYLGSSMKAGS